ncbi:MAG: glycosyltransferase family 39 protein [Candidatus Eisenbacteria bacterium]|nr:glycosyltransferase family 39 protein [Candidatus Eisenbacteria bacterium]
MSPRQGSARPRRTAPPPPRVGRQASPRTWTLNAAPEVTPAESRWLARLALGIAAALAAALLAMILGPHRIGDYFTETDFYGGYAEGARLIQHARLDPSRYGVVGPGYEIALALFGLPIRNLFFAAELISLISTVATLWLIYDLVSRRAGARSGLFAALFFATNAWVFRYGYTASTDAFAIALQMLALWLLLAQPGGHRAFVAGLVAAAAFLTRYNALYLLPAAWIAIAIDARLSHARSTALLFTAAFFTPIVPWVLWCLAHGSGFSFQLHHGIAYEVFARSKGIVWDDYQKNLQPQFHNLWDVIAKDPPAVFGHMFTNVFDHLRLDAVKLLGVPVALAALAGIALALSSGTFGALAPLAVSGALLFLSLVPTFYAERYSLALMPVYAMFAGLCFGLPRFAFALALAGRPLWIKWLAAALPLALALETSVKLQSRAIAMLPIEVLDAAHALREQARPGDAVIARKPHLAFHAGIQSVAFPFTSTIPELADYAHRHHVRWLFVSWPEVETRPRYWHLLDTTGAMPGLTPRFVTSPHPSVLYEIGPEFGRLPAWYSDDTVMTWHSARAQILVFPKNTKALISLGMVERARHHPAEARREFELAAEADPTNLQAQLLLGDVAIQQNDIRAALDDFEAALRIDPTSIDAQIGLGWATLISGRVEDAARIWRPVISRAADPTTLRRMAAVFHRLGDAEAEADAVQRYRALAGPGEEAP